MKKRMLIVLCSFMLCFVPLMAQTVAVFDFESDNFYLWGKSATMSDLLRHELVQIDTVTLVEREEIDKVTGEMDFQLEGWTDPNSVKTAGKMLNANCILTGSVDIHGDTLVVTARLIEVETAKVLYSAKMTCNTWEEFNTMLPEFAADCVAKVPVLNFFVGKWEGNIDYEDNDDYYEITLQDGTTCSVTVKTFAPDGTEISQTANGTWSYDENFIRINCTFRNPAIAHIGKIKWVSNYHFNDSKNNFNLLLPPYDSSDKRVRVSLTRMQ